MDTDKRVLVDPEKALSCGWCGSYESDRWHHDVFRTSVWCSRPCYWAGHFEEFVGMTVLLLIFDMIFITVEHTLPYQPPPMSFYTFVMTFFLFLFTALMALCSIVSYSNRRKIPHRDS